MFGTWMASAFAGTLALHAFLIAQPAHAGEINAESGIAIAGHDPVAYFRQGKPVKGSAALIYKFRDVVFQFSSAENRDAFAASPDKFAPQYGGFCAYGTSRGYKAPVDPAAFTIVKDKLYLNYSADIQQTWRKDIPGYVTKADKAWPSVKAQ